MNAIAAVVVTYNNETTILDCIKSLRQAGVKTVVVVDNASSDGMVSLVHSCPVQLIRQTKNGGFAQAANAGVKALASKQNSYILFLNPDAVLIGSLEPVVQLFEASPTLGIIGLPLVDRDGNPQRDSFGSEPTLTHLFVRNIAPLRPRLRGAIGPLGADWVSGGALLIRSDVFLQLQGFDEQFFMYWEDVDLCRRARAVGMQVARASGPAVKHERGGSLLDRRAKAAIYDQSADRYFQKHYAAPIWLLERFLRRLYRCLSPLAR